MGDRPEANAQASQHQHYNVLSEEALNLYLGDRAKHPSKSQDACANGAGDPLDAATMQKSNITRQTTERGQETSYPNGIVSIHTDDGGFAVEAPQGARQVEYSNGLSAFVDKNGKPLALLDSDFHLYVTMNGKTLEEDRNGNIRKDTNNCDMEKDLRQTYMPDVDIIYDTGKKAVLKPGKIASSDFDKYGIERNDTETSQTTKFPNGVEYATGRADLTVPPGSKVQNDESGTKVFDSKGNPIAKLDKDGTGHFYTADGTFTEKVDGSVSFSKDHPHFHMDKDSKAVHTNYNGEVRHELTAAEKARNAQAADEIRKLMEQCKDSTDPLCGLPDLDGQDIGGKKR